mmetsp:Transcript_86/g.151  ORF Transcript_86/g.151 Transcript_86/m.151 type:complete len:111 (+) Transcript_86:410-742(+)
MQLRVCRKNRRAIWSPESDCPSIEKLKGTVSCRSIAFSPDGSLFATGADDGAKLWDATSEQKIAELRSDHHQGPILSVCFSPDGALIAAAGYSKVAVFCATLSLHSSCLC